MQSRYFCVLAISAACAGTAKEVKTMHMAAKSAKVAAFDDGAI